MRFFIWLYGLFESPGLDDGRVAEKLAPPSRATWTAEDYRDSFKAQTENQGPSKDCGYTPSGRDLIQEDEDWDHEGDSDLLDKT